MRHNSSDGQTQPTEQPGVVESPLKSEETDENQIKCHVVINVGKKTKVDKKIMGLVKGSLQKTLEI